MMDQNQCGQRGDRRWLLVVVCIAVAVHGFAFLNATSPPSPDAEEYLALGRSLATTGTLVLPTGEKAKRMPLYPALVACVYKLVGAAHLESGVLAVQSALAIASTVAIALTACHLSGPWAGLVAGLLATLYAPFLYLQSLCLTETLLICLLSCSILIYVGHVAQTRSFSASALVTVSVLLALAALTRANAAVLLIPFVIDAAARRRTWPARLTRCVVLLLPTITALGAWGLRNQREVGAFTLSTTAGLNFYLGNNASYSQHPGLEQIDYAAFDRLRRETGEGEAAVDRMLTKQGERFAVEHPAKTVANTIRKLMVYHGSGTTDSAPSLFLICLGALILAGRQSARHSLLDARRRLVYFVACVGLVTTALFWLDVVLRTHRPWTDPAHLIPLGLCALVLLRSQPRVRGLFIGLYLAEMLIGLVFIPLARLRWTVDGLLIVALAVGVSNLCNWLSRGPASSCALGRAELPT